MAWWVDGWMHGWMDEDEANFAKRYQLFPPGCFKFQVVSMQTATSRIASSFFFQVFFSSQCLQPFFVAGEIRKKNNSL